MMNHLVSWQGFPWFLACLCWLVCGLVCVAPRRERVNRIRWDQRRRIRVALVRGLVIGGAVRV